jgi:biotin transport system substrate-specific component|nr:BioY family [uncultured organism]
MTDTITANAATRSRGRLSTLTTIIMGAALLTLAAKLQVPFWPVPMTLHTVAVMGFAVALGPRIAGSIVLAYLAAGAAGMPVFSGSPERGIGLAYMVGPTGGYLFGYLVAAFLVGGLAAGRGTVGRIGAMLAGLLPIYGFGAAWLALHAPVDQVFAMGVRPFILGDLVKILVVAAIGKGLGEALGRFRSTAR